MAPGSFLLNFKANLKVIIKLAFKSKRKPRTRRSRPPSPTSFILADSSESIPKSVQPVQDVTHKKEYTFVIDFDSDLDLWREILSFCEVIDIIHIGMTCRSLASITEEYWVWYSALLQICYHKRLPHLRLHMRTLSRATLQRKAISSARLDYLLRNPHLRSFPHTTSCISLQVSTIWGMSFLPGGEWLVALCRFRGSSQERILLCKTNDPLGQPSTYATMTDAHWSGVRVFTSDQQDLLLLLRSDRFDATKFSVYLIHPLEDCPNLELVCTVDASEIENCVALGSYFVLGWLRYGDGEPKHFIKVLKFAPCYREFSEHRTMEVEWEIGKRPHSYGLRVIDSQITVVVSSTELIAAYTVTPLIPISTQCEPIAVMPFWRFSCAYLDPWAVYLVPSLPAVDTPSIIVFYRNRCLFLAPSFDADPPDLHSTYFSTYTYPRSLERPILLGPHRAFWDLGGGIVGIRTLPTPLQPAFHEDGSWHTSGINTPEADLAYDVRPLAYAENYNRRVERAAWDEESGKLAVVPRPDYQRDESMTIFLVDMTTCSDPYSDLPPLMPPLGLASSSI